MGKVVERLEVEIDTDYGVQESSSVSWELEDREDGLQLVVGKLLDAHLPSQHIPSISSRLQAKRRY